jgi:hypothetical protein
VARQRRRKPAQPHPYKAVHPHQYWCIDGRQMDFALDGVKWWSIILLDGYSRTMLAGAVAPFGWQDIYRKLAVSYDRLPEIRKGGRLLAYSMINFRVTFHTS